MKSVLYCTFTDELRAVWDAVASFLTGAGWKIVTALAAVISGIIVIRIVMSILRKTLLKKSTDNTLANFILTVTKFVLWLSLFFIVAGIMSVPMTPLITALGAVALAVGLALKDSLSNLANGVMLIGMKPFKEGEYVDIDGVAGTVKSVNLLTTELLTPDNKKIILPNSKITSASITNYSAKPTRRVEWRFSLAQTDDTGAAKEAFFGILRAHPKILCEPEPEVHLDEIKDGALVFTVRGWVNNADYWDVYWEINEKFVQALKDVGISVSRPKIDVRLESEKEGKEDKK